MKIAFVGCGYVFDIYMRTRWAYPEAEILGVFDIDRARAETVSRAYGLKRYESLTELLSDAAVEIVVNLTSIGSHFDVTEAALNARKHVYSEKPITTDLARTKALFRLAEEQGVTLGGAPSNVFSDSIMTLWQALLDGAIGRPVLVYAELDDNPAHLMALERVRSPTGAPFPYQEELQEGCTVEHLAYHLVWLCAFFGPATSVCAYATCLIADKTSERLTPPDTPDLSVACITFASGVTARVTCSWVAPRNHSFRIVGDEGELWADNIFHDQSAVFLERFSRVSLAARKSFSARMQPAIGRRFGVGGRRLPLLRRWKSHAVEADRTAGRSVKQRLVAWLRRREVYAQDKLLGIAEMARAIESGSPPLLGPDFLIHLNELVLLVHHARDPGQVTVPTTSFVPVVPPPELGASAPGYKAAYRPKTAERLAQRVVDSLHR